MCDDSFIDDATHGYIEAMFFCAIDSPEWRAELTGEGRAVVYSSDFDGDSSDLGVATRDAISDDVSAFVRDNAQDIATVVNASALAGAREVGHAFYFNRNGHGTGFWDRGYGFGDSAESALRRLSDASKAYGAAHEVEVAGWSEDEQAHVWHVL